MSQLIICTLIALALTSVAAAAGARPHPLFSNNAVLQQGIEVPVFGKADPGERVTVRFLDQEISTTADSTGKWIVRLQPLKVGGPYTMRINDLEVKDILVGEVWVCSGQSNIDEPLKNSIGGDEAVAGSLDYSLRWLQIPRFASDVRCDWYDASWKVSRPSVTPEMTAVGYYFARELRKRLGVPIGIIQGGLGGTRSEWWTGRPAMEANPFFKEMLEADAKDPHRGHEHPSALYNAMIASTQPYAIRGVVWYQGESNERDAYNYRIAFPTLIKSWRDDWGQDEFPFLFVQIAPFKQIDTEPQDSDWAVVREGQLLTSRTVPNTAMAVTIGTGDQWNIHPPMKEPVGVRLSLAARSLVYGEDIVYSGPVYKSMKVGGDSIVLIFDHVHGGLVAKDGPLKGFAIAGEDRKFVWADAEIEGDKVVVRSDKVPHPVAVRYGWANYPDVNLYNAEGLPASPFRTDTWPVVTQPETE